MFIFPKDSWKDEFSFVYIYSWDMLVSVRLLTDLNREFLELWMTRTRHRQSPLVEVIKADQVRCSVLQAGPQKQIVFNGVL